MKQVMNYNKDNGLLNMIRRTDPMIKCGLPPAIISTAAHINSGGRPNPLTLRLAPFSIGTFSLFARHSSPSPRH